jgi:integrase
VGTGGPRASTIALAPEDTKTDKPRLIVLTSRAKEALRTLPSRFKKKGYVFVNPKTKTRRVDIKKSFRRAVAAAELPGLWFHDLRPSFITRARRVGVPESVVMRMSGHRTRAVFERYNVVDTQDLRAAVRALESLGPTRASPVRLPRIGGPTKTGTPLPFARAVWGHARSDPTHQTHRSPEGT